MAYYNGKKVLSVVQVKEVEVDYYVGVATLETEKKDEIIVPQNIKVNNTNFPILDGTKTSVVELGGNSVAFNQLADRYNLYTPNGLTIAQSGNGRFVLNGTTTALTTIYFILTATQNHKYLLKTNKSAPTDYSKFRYRINNVYAYDSAILTPATSGSVAIDIKEGVTFDNVEFVINIHDLTLMGLDNITSVEEFNALFPDDYYPYNAGEIKSTIISKIESWGANLCDKTTLSGYSYANDYLKYNDNNSMFVKAGITYTFYTPTENLYLQAFSSKNTNAYLLIKNALNVVGLEVSSAYCWDGRGLQTIPTVRKLTFTPKVDCYITICGQTKTLETPTLVIGTTALTTYVPYVGKLGQINIPNAPLKLDGVNDIHNTLTFVEQSDGTYNAILTKKIGIVDLGTLNWSYDGDNTRFYSEVMPDITICQYGSSNPAPNMICQRYETKNTYYLDVSGSNMLISTNNSSSAKMIFVKDTSYTDATTFKTAMSGVILLFELATPTTEVIATGLTFDRVATLFEKGGTLEIVNANSDYIKTNSTMAVAVRRFKTEE